jgi:formate/nitrite transporter FocA (FNT family)
MARDKSRSESSEPNIEKHEAEDIERRTRLRAPVIYEIVRREGETEMDRPIASLWWSGVAAGLSISFSLLTQALLHRHLPDAPWRLLVAGLGYPVGFLMVVLGRQQLFTENTLTAVLPVFADLRFRNLARLARLWGIVLAANITGTLLAALFCEFTPVLTAELRETMIHISRETMAASPLVMVFKGISAGFLIAAMVWLLPSAEGSQFHVVAVMTYLIPVGGFTHIVAGSVDAFLLLAAGQLGLGELLTGFFAPVLVGNVIGGTALFGLLSYAQVMKEM